MATCFVAATLVTTALTTVGAVVAGNVQSDRSEKIQQVSAFVKSTQEFDPLVRSYMDTVLDGGDMEKAKKALAANLQQQHILLGAADDYLTPSERARADEYRQTLVEIDEGLSVQTRDPLTGKQFAQGVADAAAQRERVIAALRREASLPADPISQPPR